MSNHTRRSFSKEYKAEVIDLIRNSDKSISTLCRELDLTETAVRRWLKQAEIDSGRGPSGALTTAEREELTALRRQVREHSMEREILKKRRPSSRRRASEISLHRRGEGLLPHSVAVPLPGGLEIRLLRLARSFVQPSISGGRTVEGQDLGFARREPSTIQEPLDPS